MDENNIKLDLDFIDKLLNSKNDIQLNLFEDNQPIGAATISHAAAGNIYPYVATGTSGGTYTLSNGTGWDTWNNNIKPGALHVKGDAEFDGDVKIKGKSLTDILDKIEERLAILHPNEKLEDKWEKLKELGDAYRALEKDILEKEKIWETLKK